MILRYLKSLLCLEVKIDIQLKKIINKFISYNIQLTDLEYKQVNENALFLVNYMRATKINNYLLYYILKKIKYIDKFIPNFYNLIFYEIDISLRDKIINDKIFIKYKLIKKEKSINIELKEEKNDEIKIITDIDDTIIETYFSNNYPNSKTIPGISKIIEIINKNKNPIVFLSARPKLGGILIKKTNKTLKNKFSDNILGKNFIIIYGCFIYIIITFIGLIISIIYNKNNSITIYSNKKIGYDKYKKATKYLDLYPNTNFIFFGDNSQGDELVGKLLLENYNDRIKAVYIRNVKKNNILDILKNININKYKICSKYFIHNSYLEVSLNMYFNNLITFQELNEIKKDFNYINKNISQYKIDNKIINLINKINY